MIVKELPAVRLVELDPLSYREKGDGVTQKMMAEVRKELSSSRMGMELR
jgi:hypothetical protein